MKFLKHIVAFALVLGFFACHAADTASAGAGAGAAAAHAVGAVRNNPDYAVNAPSFILVSSDGQEIGVPEKVITDTFKGKPLSLVLNKLFSSGMSETGKGKANADFPADTLRTFIDVLIAMHILAGTGIDLENNQEIIEAFSKQLPSLTGDDTTHYPALLTIADYYGVAFLAQTIGYHLAHSPEFIEEFLQNSKPYKDFFTKIPYTIPIAIGPGNWLLQTTLRGHTSAVKSVAFSPNGQQIVSGSYDDTIKIWHKDTNGTFNPEPQTLRGHPDDINSVAFSPNGQQIVSGSHDESIEIWHKNPDGSFDPEPQQTLRGHTGIVFSVTFSPDGQQIVSGSSDKTIKTWTKNPDGSFNPEPQTLRGHAGTVYSVTFSPDGQQIVSGSLDRTINIWTKNPDGSFNPEPQTLRGHTGAVISVTFSPDGQQIVSGSYDNTIKIWHKDLITRQCSLLQALLIEAIKQAPGMTLDIREETGANQVLREIARSLIGTPAKAFVRAHVRMDWASHAGAGSSSSSATVTDQGESAGAH